MNKIKIDYYYKPESKTLRLDEVDYSDIKQLLDKLRQKNKQLEEQATYLRRSCERKEEKIYEQYDEIVGLDTKIDKMIEDINFCLHSIKQEMKLSKDERTRSEMTNCYKILSVYEKGDVKNENNNV